MTKLTLNDISNLTGNPTSAESLLNENFALIESAIENTLSRDGLSPNPLEASLDANSQRIINLPYALTGSEPVTLAQVYALITGADWTGGAGIPSVVFYQDEEPTATASGQVWVKTSDLSIWIWTGTDWIRQEDPNLQLAINTANDASLAVALLEPRVLAVEEDSANYNLAIIELQTETDSLAASISSVTADIAGNTAAISNEAIARANADGALASAINSIQAFTNKIYIQTTPPVDSPPGTIDEGDFWYDSNDGNHPYRWSSGAWVSVQDTSISAPLYAAIEVEETARIGQDTALANSITSLQAQRESDYSLIVNNNLASIAADSALAVTTNSLQAQLNSTNSNVSAVSASVSNEAAVRLAADNALASTTSTLTSTVNGHTASISANTSSINGIHANYTIKIDNNGYITGFGLTSTGATAAPNSTFTVLANNFRIVTPGQNPIIPFQVIGGTTYIKDVIIDTAAIGTATIGTTQVVGRAITDMQPAVYNFNGSLGPSVTQGVFSPLSTVYGLAKADVSGIAVPGSIISIRGYFNAERSGSQGEYGLIRIRRSDGVVLPSTLSFRVNDVPQIYAWEWIDTNPVSTLHTYVVEVTRPSGNGYIGRWYDISLIATIAKR